MADSPNARCRSCGAPVLWITTEKGKRMPVNAEPADGGNVIIDPTSGIGHYVPKQPGQLAHVSHFATCPESEKWRRDVRSGAIGV